MSAVGDDAQPPRRRESLALSLLRYRKSRIEGELYDLREERARVVRTHEAALQRHLTAMNKINTKLRALEVRAEALAAQWKQETQRSAS